MDFFLLVYDHTDMKSFDDLRRDWNPICHKYAVGTPKLLVGTKIDKYVDERPLFDRNQHYLDCDRHI